MPVAHTSSLAIPTLHTALQIFLIVFLIGFTAPSSILRPAAIPLQALFLYLAFISIENSSGHGNRAKVTSIRGILLLTNLDAVLLSRWSFAHRGPTSTAGGL